jgi:hypothetical protein
MTQRPIIDAGPGLNFLSINSERLLIAMLGRLSAPAVVEAEVLTGADVIVLIDDGLGARIATQEIRRLDRLRSTDGSVGRIRLASTLTVLEKAAGTTYVQDKTHMREIYRRLRNLDDGLPPIEKTTLLTTTRWTTGA